MENYTVRLQELEFVEFSEVQSLFSESKHLSFTIDAVIAGNSPMRIWVDDVNKPRSALLWDNAHCYYLVGDPGNRDFCKTIETFLYESLIPKAVAKNREIYKLEYSPQAWEPIIEDILKDKTPVKISRKFFVLEKPLISQWQDILPPDFSIRRIDRFLLESDVKHVKSIIDEINGCWYSVDEFLTNGFGFCLVYRPKIGEEEVQGWCTGEYFSKGKCGVGIETFHGYQKRGFATVMASAFVEHSLSVNIQPHWDASANNEGSIRVAEKVGFREIQDYQVFYGSFTNSE